MIEINRAKAINLLEQVVDLRGRDFRYQQEEKVITIPEEVEPVSVGGCWYELNGAPSCGVGVALHLAGVPLTVLDTMDQRPGDTCIGDVSWILEDNGLRLTQEALNVFEKFQSYQDLDSTWGDALDAARKVS